MRSYVVEYDKYESGRRKGALGGRINKTTDRENNWARKNHWGNVCFLTISTIRTGNQVGVLSYKHKVDHGSSEPYSSPVVMSC